MTDGSSEINVTSGHPFRILVAGHALSGKDTAARMLSEASGGILRSGLSTSEFYCRKVYPDNWSARLTEFKATPKGRQNLAHLIAFYNKHERGTPHWPGAQLYGEMVCTGIDVIVGIRRLEEVVACVKLKLLTHAVWVERDVPTDATQGYEAGDLPWLFGNAVYVVWNKEDLADLPQKVRKVWERIRGGVQ